MFDKLLKLLKNIQFWTIAGTIATIITLIVSLPGRKKPVTLSSFISSDRSIENMDISLEGDSLVIIYEFGAIGGTNYIADYFTVDLPLCLKAPDKEVATNINVYGYAENYDTRIWETDQYDRRWLESGSTWPRFVKSDYVNRNVKIEYTSFDKDIDKILHHRPVSIPVSLYFYNPHKNTRPDHQFVENGIEYEDGIDFYANGGVIDDFYFDLHITQLGFDSRIIKVHAIGMFWPIDLVQNNIDDRPYKTGLDSLKQLYPNALTVLTAPDSSHKYWLPQEDSEGVYYMNFHTDSYYQSDNENIEDNNESLNIFGLFKIKNLWLYYFAIILNFIILGALILLYFTENEKLETAAFIMFFISCFIIELSGGYLIDNNLILGIFLASYALMIILFIFSSKLNDELVGILILILGELPILCIIADHYLTFNSIL